MNLHFESIPKAPLMHLFRRRKGLSRLEDFPKIAGAIADLSAPNLHAYQRICGIPESDIFPICYPQILATSLHMHMLTAKPFPFSVLGLVHVRQQIQQQQPLTKEMSLHLRARIDALRQVKSGVEFDIHTEILEGEHVLWHAISTTLSRGMKGDGNKRPSTVPSSVEGQSYTLDVPENLGRRYMKISGDVNPIHIHALLAKPFGFRKAIIHGMWTLARVVSHLDLHSLDARFVRPVFLPSRSRIVENEEEILVQSDETSKTQLYVRINS